MKKEVEYSEKNGNGKKHIFLGIHAILKWVLFCLGVSERCRGEFADSLLEECFL